MLINLPTLKIYLQKSGISYLKQDDTIEKTILHIIHEKLKIGNTIYVCLM